MRSEVVPGVDEQMGFEGLRDLKRLGMRAMD